MGGGLYHLKGPELTSTAARNGKAPKFGLPVGKFLELSQKTNKPGPYPITSKLVVTPPTKKRREQMRDAERRIVVGQAQLNIAYSLTSVPAPPLPAQAPAAPIADLGDDATDDDKAAAVAAAEEANKAAAAEYKRDVAVWKTEVGQWRENLTGAQNQINELTEQVKQAEIDYDRAFLGDQYDEIVEFFDEQDESLWEEFRIDLAKHWVPSQPDTEDEEAGKPSKSSTG